MICFCSVVLRSAFYRLLLWCNTRETFARAAVIGDWVKRLDEPWCGNNTTGDTPELRFDARIAHLSAQILVFDRKEPLQGFLNTCRGKLHIKKKAKGAALLEGEEVSRPCENKTVILTLLVFQ